MLAQFCATGQDPLRNRALATGLIVNQPRTVLFARATVPVLTRDSAFVTFAIRSAGKLEFQFSDFRFEISDLKSQMNSIRRVAQG